jgi:hypothetical protein
MSAPSPSVFVSYRRRGDAPGAAGRLYDRLEARFDPASLFRDIDSIEMGADWSKVLHDAIDSCQVMLVVIGPAWLELRDERGERRLDDPDDYVRREVELGLAQVAHVVPVLVGGGRLPAAAELPEPLRGLADRQYRTIDDDTFNADAAELIDDLARLVDAPPAPAARRSRWRAIAMPVVALALLAAAGLLVVPGLRDDPPIAGTITKLDLRKNQRFAQYVSDTRQPSTRYTDGDLEKVGNVVTVFVQLRGYKNEELHVDWSLFDADTGEQIPGPEFNQVDTLQFTPRSDDHAGTGKLWVPLPRRDGRFFVRVSLIDRRGQTVNERDSQAFESVAL